MRTWLAWVSALALCASPALAQERERGRDRGDGGRSHSAEQRHPEPAGRPSRGSSRDGGGRASRGAPQPSDPGPRGTYRRGSDDRATRREAAPVAPPRYPANRDFSHRDFSRPGDGRYSQRPDPQRRYSERNDGYSQRGNRGSWGRSDGYRRDDHGWRGSYYGGRYRYRGRGYGYHRAYPYYSYRPYYRWGYFYGHGYYFPRYYFDIEAYPAYGAIRTLVGPDQTEVYLDGYYAGVADDFDGLFQHLRVTPGTHEITLRLDGFVTWTAEVFAAPGQTIDLHHDMVPGASEIGPDPGRYEQPGANEPPYGDVPPSGYEQAPNYGQPPDYGQQPGDDGQLGDDGQPGEYGQPGEDEPPPGADQDSGPPPQN
jgi:hypothetical protein